MTMRHIPVPNRRHSLTALLSFFLAAAFCLGPNRAQAQASRDAIKADSDKAIQELDQ